MFSWFYGSRTDNSATEDPANNTSEVIATPTSPSNASFSHLGPGFQMYRLLVLENRKKDIAKIQALQNDFIVQVDYTEAFFNKMLQDCKQNMELNIANSTDTSTYLSERDEKNIGGCQALTEVARQNITLYFTKLNERMENIIAQANRGGLAYNLTNQLQFNVQEDINKALWQIKWYLQNNNFDNKNNFFLTISNTNLQILFLVTNKISTLKEAAQSFFDRLLNDKALELKAADAEEFVNLVAKPLAIFSQDLFNVETELNALAEDVSEIKPAENKKAGLIEGPK